MAIRRLLPLAFPLVSCVLASTNAHAHHSFSEYDSASTIEVTGKLLDVAWQNPHVHFTLEARDASGKTQTWDIESASLSILRRTDATPDNLKVGDTVTFAGNPSKRSPTRLSGTNVLTAARTEVVLVPGMKPHWQTNAAGLKTTWFDGASTGDAKLGLFRVWSSKLGDSEAQPASLWLADYPLTPAARKKASAWNPVTDVVAQGCVPKGMPTIMEEPYPIEFVQDGDVIRLRIEEYDTLRTIDMTGAAASLPKTLLGRSTGRWDGKTLVVATSRIDWPYLDSNGVPLGPNATLVERFTPDDAGTRLNYQLTVTDPDTFTQPLALKRAWVWRQGETVKPYNCQSR
jgi:hypothetical protein